MYACPVCERELEGKPHPVIAHLAVVECPEHGKQNVTRKEEPAAAPKPKAATTPAPTPKPKKGSKKAPKKTAKKKPRR